MLLSFGLLVLAVVILFYGAEFSLTASEKIGAKLGLSPLIIGMVLVGFGTSLPEFFVAHIAACQDKPGLAIGGLIGSNIANMFLILGICGFITKFSVFTQGILKHLSVHLVLGIILIFVLNQKELTLLSSTPLLLLSMGYLFLLKKDISKDFESEEKYPDAKPVLLALQLIVGFVLLYFGGELLVESGSDLCLHLGMSEYLVSAIFVAFGTSFPELVTALLASLKKKHTDLIIGNIVGSNLFNCAFILGSLGYYNFQLSIDFTYELIFLIAGAAALLSLSLLKKHFHYAAATIFMASYAIIVLKWINII